MTTTTTEYISCADTARMLRKALKSAHPQVRFTVRSDTYAGGASIRVAWTDGPTEAQVQQTTGLYEGATFDGMTDYKDYRTALLSTDEGARVVHFGADFIITTREYSAGFVARMAETAVRDGLLSRSEQCRGCGNWMSGECWTVPDPTRHTVEFICSPACAVRAVGRHYEG